MKQMNRRTFLASMPALFGAGHFLGQQAQAYESSSFVPNVGGQNLGAFGQLEPFDFSKLPMRRQAVGSEDNYDVYLYAIRLPLRANGLWDARAAGTVQELYKKKYLPSDVGSKLEPSNIIQDTRFLDNDTLWFATRIVAKNGAKLNINMLRFGQKSSDSVNSLANSYNLVGGNFAYSPQTLGVIWGAGGERAHDTILSSGDGNQMVDELVFVGIQSAYYKASSQSEIDNVRNYIQTNNLALTSWIEVVKDNVVVATGSRVLQWLPSGTDKPILSIDRSAGQVRVGFTGTPGRSGIIQSTAPVGGSWATEAVVNNGSIITRSTTGPSRIYRAFYQPMP